MIPLYIPSPSQGVWYLGPLPLRAYALCVLTGIITAWLIIMRRWRRLGGDTEKLETLLFLTVICGIVGARLYWVIIEWPRYFGPNGVWYHIFYIWQGGLGIMGGVAAGLICVVIGGKKLKINVLALCDCVAPALPIAQGIGRLGNWWNQELYGLPTTLPWALEIDAQHRVAGYEQFATFHPTFLYEMIWDFALAAFLILVGQKVLRLGRGKLLACYIIGYAIGRFIVEEFRIDPVAQFGPLRINAWVTIAVVLAGAIWLAWLLRYRPGPNLPDAAATGGSETADDQAAQAEQLVPAEETETDPAEPAEPDPAEEAEPDPVVEAGSDPVEEAEPVAGESLP